MTPVESAVPWRRMDMGRFRFAAEVDGVWWVLRINGFPDHPMWTLFVDGKARYDIDDHPRAWILWEAPALDEATARVAVAPVEGFAVYGSEVGLPCDDPVCCDV